MTAEDDAKKLMDQLLAGASSPADRRALLTALLNAGPSPMMDLLEEPRPEVRAVPVITRGFRVRLDLRGTKPPVWRRLELPGDLTLPRLHEVIQAAMGWTDSHLHRFRTGVDRRSPHFITDFDLDEGEDGILEDEVRLDQLVASPGDRLGYEYDFGDDWDHVLTVEQVLDTPPSQPRCTGGRLACPPEDCGGIGGHDELAQWVRSGHDDALLPLGLEDAEHGHGWLPPGWHPDEFDIDEANDALAIVSAEPAAVTEELGAMIDQLYRRGDRSLRDVLAHPTSHEPAEISDEDAARLTEPYRVFLETIGEGVKLTQAGYLPPAIVDTFAERSGISAWWIGKANREDLTWPVQEVRETARGLGLVTVRKGRLTPTVKGARVRGDARALWRHIVSRLPLGTKDIDHDAGWLALAVVGSGVPAESWSSGISDLLARFGWRTDHPVYWLPPAISPTLFVLEFLAGSARTSRRLTGVNAAVAATARAVTRRP